MRATLSILLALSLISCSKPLPPPGPAAAEPGDEEEWRLILKECKPIPTNPEVYECNRDTLRRAYNIMSRMHWDIIECSYDEETLEEKCRIRVARVQAKLDSPWHAWWLWTMVGIITGAAVGAGATFGLMK